MKTQAPKVEQAADPLFVCVAKEEHVKPLINVINVARTLKSLQWKSFAIFLHFPNHFELPIDCFAAYKSLNISSDWEFD